MILWRYKVTWDDGRTADVTIRPGDVARFEAQMGRTADALRQAEQFTSWCHMLLVHKAVVRMKLEPVQDFDEFLDSVDLELVEFGEPEGKALGRAASSGRLPRSRSNTASTR